VDPAPAGTTPACRGLVSQLPAELAGQPRRGTDGAPGVAAWGDPAILLICGTTPLGATTLPCLSVDGVDWIVLAQDDQGGARFATFGRDPAVEVEVPSQYAPAPGALAGLADTVSDLPQGRECS
jgi:hypothetical protein